MRRLVGLLLVSILMVAPASAEKQRVGDWILDIQTRGTEAYTENGSGSSFGLLCMGGSCSGYVDTNTPCEVNAQLPLLINADAGSTYVVGRCVHYPQSGRIRYVVAIQGSDIVTAISSGSVIGFALALKSGEFKVVRFSLEGAQDATSRAAAAMKASKSQFRDTNL